MTATDKDSSVLIGTFECMPCYPRLCRCICPHGISMGAECEPCGRQEENIKEAEITHPDMFK